MFLCCIRNFDDEFHDDGKLQVQIIKNFEYIFIDNIVAFVFCSLQLVLLETIRDINFNVFLMFYLHFLKHNCNNSYGFDLCCR